MPSSSFRLEPASRSDIARLAEIHVIACLPDNAFKLYFANAAEFTQKVTAMLEGQVGDPAYSHTKAVDDATGTLAAWASWYTPSDEQLRKDADKGEADNGDDDEQSKKKESKGQARGEFDFPPGLPAYVHADTDRWLQRATRRRRHTRCLALFTDPMFQRRGMGSALVRYGNKVADERALPIFLQASPYGFPVYHRYGFDTVQHLDVDLCEWAPDAKRNDKGFGVYRFRYMLRLPETLPVEETGK